MRHLILAALMVVANNPLAIAAEAYPEKSIRFVVPFPPGGGADAFVRLVGGKMGEFLGQSIIVDNRAGAQGNIGTASVAKAPADGYTILLAHQGALTINPHLYRDPGFQSLRDFAPISRGMEAASILVAHPSVPVTTMKELADHAARNPGKLTYASSASLQQLLGELFKQSTKTDLVHVPYKGAGPAMNDLLAGNVGILFANPTGAMPHVKGGKLRALAVLGTRRNEALPDVPTAVEAGYPALAELVEWYGVVAPAGTPAEVIGKLNAAVVRALRSADVAGRLTALGQTPSPSTPDELAKLLRSDFERWAMVVKAANIKVE